MEYDIRLIVSDIDGTLLDRSSRMTDYTRQAIHDAQAAGVTFACCSGRFPENAAMVMAAAGIACPVISTHGAVVEMSLGGERVFEKFMHPSAAREVF
ncbi:MAG TPA: HAD hydrolase family protein, partial [Candidatus Limnocylindria bacterium]|nr:HAD hydrolase family protein [Candidatus Limnocylindria bacterium]